MTKLTTTPAKRDAQSKPARLASATDVAKVESDLRTVAAVLSKQQGKLNAKLTALEGTLWTIQQTQQQLSKDVQRLITILQAAAAAGAKR